MLQVERIRHAAEDVVAAALLADGWVDALDRFAAAAGARHAVLMRNTPRRVVSCIATDGATDAIREYMAGRIPPNSRYRRVHGRYAAGFRVDHDDYSDEQLSRDPYYQEFLRAHGVFWHANAVLTAGRDEYVELSLKRGLRSGPYQNSEVVGLDQSMPQLRAAMRVAQAMLDAEVRGMSSLLRARSELVVEIDARGRVRGGAAVVETRADIPLRITAGRLTGPDPVTQGRIDRAIATVTARPGRSALVPIDGPEGRRHLLQLLPVPGIARDVFLAASAVAVLLPHRDTTQQGSNLSRMLRHAFALTEREAEIACLLASGFDLAAISARLGLASETVRTYLKAVYGKTGTGRQAELVALLAVLQPVGAAQP